MVMVFAALAGYAVEPEAEALFEPDEGGSWMFSVGSVWRSRVKIETSGRIAAEHTVASSTKKRDMSDSANWDKDKAELVAHPNAGEGTLAEDDVLWGIDDERVETYTVAGQDYVVNMSDVERPMGVSLQAAYTLYQTETWSVALAVRFAGYWNMKSSSSGRYAGASKVTETWADHYVFPEEAADADFDPDPEYGTIAANGSTLKSREVEDSGSRTVATRFRGDLYQLGIGPNFVWSPFAEGAETAGWLDLFCTVELLGNVAHSTLKADGDSASDTTFLFGVGAALGAAAYFTENCGVYGQVGYEWIDDTDVAVGGFRTDVDYSSLVVSAGFQLWF